MRRQCMWCQAERTPTGLLDVPIAHDARDHAPICWFHRLLVLLGSPWRDGVAFLVIVPRSEPGLFAWASEKFLDEPRVQVLMDRRQAGRRPDETAGDERSGERRTQVAPWDDARFDAVRIVATWPKAEPQRVLAPAGGGQRADDLAESPQAIVERWARDGERLIREVLPPLFERHGALRQRVATAEETCASLSARLRDLTDEAERLRAAGAAWRAQRIEILGAVADVVGHLDRLVREIAIRAPAADPAPL